jgi:hypothetical protein
MRLVSFIVLSTLLFICNARHLICDFGEWSDILLPNRQHCIIKAFDLSKSIAIENEELTFSGSDYEKNQTKCLVFYYSEVVEYIPKKFQTVFPNLNQLEISRGNAPVIKAGLFTKHYSFLTFLNLNKNKINEIKKGAFAELINLEWISLTDNNLRKLSENIFEKNGKLKFIRLSKNQIHSIVPDFFEPLTSLEVLMMNENSCVDRTLKTEDGSLEIIGEFLGYCYRNDESLY